MDANSRVVRFGRMVQWSAISLAICGLLFRSVVWASWPPYRDEPYGAADILEGLIAFAILGLCAVCLVVGLIIVAVPRWRDRQLATRLLLKGAVLPVAYSFAHTHVPTFRR